MYKNNCNDFKDNIGPFLFTEMNKLGDYAPTVVRQKVLERLGNEGFPQFQNIVEETNPAISQRFAIGAEIGTPSEEAIANFVEAFKRTHEKYNITKVTNLEVRSNDGVYTLVAGLVVENDD